MKYDLKSYNPDLPFKIAVMTYKHIKIDIKHNDAQGELTDSELDEILSDLNQEKFSRRTPLIYGEYDYQDPDDLQEREDYCHATARKFSRDNPELEVVSGYIVIVEPRVGSVKLVSHSVVRDTGTDILWELMYTTIPDFIERSPDIKGYDLLVY